MKKLVLSTALLVLGMATLATPAKAAKKATKFSLIPSTTAVTRKSVKVSVAVKKKAKIKEIRYRAGKVTKKANKYWKRAKSITKKKSFSAPYNGWYSVRLKNKAGKYTVRNIQIQCIDKTAPSVKQATRLQIKLERFPFLRGIATEFLMLVIKKDGYSPNIKQIIQQCKMSRELFR